MLPQDPNQNPTPQPVVNPPVAPQQVQAPIIQPVVAPTLPQPQQANPSPAPQSTTSAIAMGGEYVSNPFTASVNGLLKILKQNSVPILLLTFYGYLVFFILYLAMILLPIVGILLAIIFVYIFGGMTYCVAADSLAGQKNSLGKSFSKSLSKFLPLLGLSILLSLLLILGFIALILPGIWLLGRTGLAPLIMFVENKGPITSIKRSFELTKGHTIEMLGAIWAGIFLTNGYGLLGPASTLAPLVERYQGLLALKQFQTPKPAIHWANYIFLILPIIFILGLVATMAITDSSVLQKKAREAKQQQVEQPIQTNLPDYKYSN